MTSFTLYSHESIIFPTTLIPEISVKNKIERLLGDSKIETCSDFKGKVMDGVYFTEILANSLAEASFSAYNDHRTLILSPDHIWITLTQGLANHINKNSEKLCHSFVNHKNKLKLKVRKNEFTKGALNNSWPSVFEEFSEKIASHIGRENHTNFIANFSTTGLIEKSASELVLLNAMSNYFNFAVGTMCGIPKFILEGDENDWITIRNRVLTWEKYELGWWIEQLLPCLDQFILASQGNVKKDWWKNWFKEEHEGSGNFYLSGHIINFFPYISQPNSSDKKETPLIKTQFEKMTTDQFPGGLSSVPFIWKYYEQTFQMEFIGGFVGTSQHADPDTNYALRPKIGWAIRDVSNSD